MAKQFALQVGALKKCCSQKIITLSIHVKHVAALKKSVKAAGITYGKI